jgi:STE24 endopeptidase
MLEINFNAYAAIWSVVGVFMTKYAPERFSGEITHSLLFFFFYNFASTILELPLGYYHHFVLEEKFGFNKMTMKLWIMDKIKGQLLTIAFGTPIGAGVLAIIKHTGDSFFYWVWLFMFGVQLIAVTIYPIIIVPIFNKLTPLSDGALKKAIDGLAGRLKFPLTELQVIDGSKRSSHSNAYFTGLPWKKKIVLFDTLIEQQTEEQVVAVLAHELGHWSLGHTTKLIAINSVHLFFIFSLFSAFVHNKQMFAEFGFEKQMPVIIGFFLFSEVLTPSECVLQFAMNSVTRKFEYQAGLFSPIAISDLHN